MNALKAAYFWTLVGVATIIFFSLMCLYRLVAIAFRMQHPDRASHSIASMWAKFIVYGMPGWKVIITGKENLPSANEAVVLVANHESMTDVGDVPSRRAIPMVIKSELIPIAAGGDSNGLVWVYSN